MNKSILVILVIMILVAFILAGFVLINKTGYSTLSYEKCQETNDDDCWHSLAHQTFNKSLCYKIKNNEIKEHCLKHFRW